MTLTVIGGMTGSSAAAPPANYADELVRSVPAASHFAPLPDGRLLITAKSGQLYLVRADGSTPSGPILDLAGTVCTDGDRGLLGVAANPDFQNNGKIYLYYVHKGGSAACGGADDVGRVSEWTMNGESTPLSNSNLIDNIPSASPLGLNVGGDMKFGNDGNLYIGVGDGYCEPVAPNGCGAFNTTSLDPRQLTGKILRIRPGGAQPANAHTTADAVSCATAPAPAAKQCREIFESGLRNPSLALDSNVAGTSYLINDEGFDTAEEVNVGANVGADYGWNAREADCKTGFPADCAASTLPRRDPIYVYAHTTGCDTISAGAMLPTGLTGWSTDYPGSRYFFADKTCGKIFHLDRASLPAKSAAPTFATDMGAVTSMRFIQNTAGLTGWALHYTTSANGGELRRIRYAPGGASTTSTTTTTSTPPVVSVPPGSPQPATFVPVSPSRVLDTRTSTGGLSGPNTPNVARRFGFGTAVPSAATAVSVNVTMTGTSARGFLRLWPTGTLEPTVSNLNVSDANETVANASIVMLPTTGTGQLDLVSNIVGHVVVDLSGYWIPSGPTAAGRFMPVSPVRVLDERNPPGPGVANGVGTRKVVLAGKGGIPASGVSAVAFTLTADQVAGPGDARVWPFGELLAVEPPLTSVLNLNSANDIRANLVIVRLGQDGAINLYSSVGARYLIDVAGWFTDTSSAASSTGLFVAMAPQRRVDTRLGLGTTRLLADLVATVSLTPEVGGTIRAASVVHNVTVTQTGAAGFVAAYPANGTRPLASNVNFTGLDQDRAALAITSVDDLDRLSYVSNTSTGLVVDLAGYFTK